MRISVEAEVFRLFPQFCRGLVVAKGVDNSRSVPELDKLLRAAEEQLRADQSVEIATHPRLLAWKDAYLKFGANPNKFTPSILFLAKQVKAGKPIRSISPAVDAFNVISLKYLIPCGGDDMGSVDDMTLALAKGDETFAPLFKPHETEHPGPGEVIYMSRQSGRIMCRRWNWRNADFSKITPETRNLVINVDGMIPSISRQEIERATDEMASLIVQYCGGSVAVHYLEVDSPGIEIME